jgi:carbon starvation protein CstA
MNAMPLLIAALAFFALAYRFYFNFIAAKVAVINLEFPVACHRDDIFLDLVCARE